MMILAIFIGSSIGTILRYIMINIWSEKARYLTGVFAANMLGTFMMGLLLSINQLHVWDNSISVGALGGLTTFSTMMTQSAQRQHQAVYLVIHIFSGLISFGLGMLLGLVLR